MERRKGGIAKEERKKRIVVKSKPKSEDPNYTVENKTFRVRSGVDTVYSKEKLNQLFVALCDRDEQERIDRARKIKDKVESVRLAFIESGGTPHQLCFELGTIIDRAYALYSGLDFRDITVYELIVMQDLTRLNEIKKEPKGTIDLVERALRVK